MLLDCGSCGFMSTGKIEQASSDIQESSCDVLFDCHLTIILQISSIFRSHVSPSTASHTLDNIPADRE